MTKALYLQDTYLFEATAKVVVQGHDDRGAYVVLDETVFYPQGGGQPSDMGTLKGNGFESAVVQVREVEGEIRHYVAGVIPEGAEVTCQVNPLRRLLNARYHTAAHLLGNVVEEIYPALKAVKGHSFPQEAYVEFQGEVVVDEAQVLAGLEAAIARDMQTQVFDIAPEEFETQFYKLPYVIPGNKAFRVMQIGDYMPIPCGGTHLGRTGEIGTVTIGKIKMKGGMVKVPYGVG